MKNLYLTSLFILFIATLHAQVDTVLYEGFQFDVLSDMDSLTNGTNMNWVNYDEDGLTSNVQTPETQRWYYREEVRLLNCK